eukprot:CAMPEP_0182418038 /NCGR_PEP_ID=MMETSP1167-20130531/2498_1 /TAXON_ID=2988 /ORGANISM="Mallomonas Sp, Strain CCMP3275" /LENGTH=506 /DNA_ID=CAMNT_0024592003 /DNA_START=76 /DNA_END=1593 /DNA_ORIENTATION=-
MVLAELGHRLTTALRRLQSTTVVDDEVVASIQQDICRALLEADVNVKIVGKLRNNIKARLNLEEQAAGTNRQKLVQRVVMEELVSMLSPAAKPYEMKKGKPNVVMFVGLQGAGKTTTIGKFANYYQRKGWRTAMVCADTFRAGAFDQLKQNATKLRVPFYGSYTEADPVRIAEEGVAQFRKEKFEVIIVDTSGRHRQEEALFDEMQEIQSAVQPDNIVFVMDATQGQAVFDQATAFKEAVQVGSVVITKLDGHAKGGGALSAVAATGSPIIFLGSGEHFDDLDPFNAQSFVSRLLGLGDVRGLMEEIKNVVDSEDQADMERKFGKGIFTLRDMYEQFQTVMKLGPLSKVMGMIPGMPSWMSQQTAGGGGGGGDGGNDRIKVFMCIMDSMTNAELDGKVDFSPSRLLRIARGSGTHPEYVQVLLKCHKQFEGVVKKMGKSGLMTGGEKMMNQRMQRNPQGVMQQLSRAMDPRMLAQMGGAGNVMNMMKEMSKMDMNQMSALGGMGGM